MRRNCTWAVTLLLAALGVANSGPASPPVIKLGMYAPRAFYWPDQADPPVRIVGFENNRSEIRWVLSNISGKAVTGVLIMHVMISPTTCSTRSMPGESASGGSRYQVFIPPHGQAILSRHIDHYPRMMVVMAQRWGTTYLQTQFGIDGVYFQDGTTWPMPFDSHSHGSSEPFDPELVKSAARKCFADAKVAAALDMVDVEDVNGIVFERESPQAGDLDAEHGVIPQLHFSCTLEGGKAICHMPPENKPSGPD